MQFIRNTEKKTITVIRSFDASLELTWQAWTESEILEQWWAPHPWKAVTKTMDFRNGGRWLYAMIGPDGTKLWSRVDFKQIVPHTSFSALSSFCDAEGNINPEFAQSTWTYQFRKTEEGAEVEIRLEFASDAQMKQLVDMGFEAGFTSALSNLDHYLITRFKLHLDAKVDNRPRVTSYLNFPGTTEKAFRFYKKVFGGEFTGVGLQRFGDVKLPAEAPPMNEADKKLILHAELTILGGHVLMATDAPESMGFKMQTGNNMHINVEPESRKETKRLFDALSEGGTVTMPLKDMFFGAYFAELTDQFGINWMLTFQNETK
jgi:uncharacterized glyoxalase superfamily protein PhnB/uncharacterized protein YndB with AHSA1/START domain